MLSFESTSKSSQLAGRVIRYHTWPMIRRPTVAESSARVATLYCELWGIPRAEVLYYCLKHDDGEFFGGDTPFYAKRKVPALKEGCNLAEQIGLENLGVKLPELTEEEFLKFKMADYLEMWETAVVEANMGNRYALLVIENLKAVVGPLAMRLNEWPKILEWTVSNTPECGLLNETYPSV